MEQIPFPNKKYQKGEGTMKLKDIQKMAVGWNKKNFGDHFGSGYRNLLGIAEEVGELCHAQLKGEQGIRHTPEEILKMKKDAVGDIIIFLCNYCDSQNISLDDCVNYAWDEIKNRDWKNHHPHQKVEDMQKIMDTNEKLVKELKSK